MLHNAVCFSGTSVCDNHLAFYFPRNYLVQSQLGGDSILIKNDIPKICDFGLSKKINLTNEKNILCFGNVIAIQFCTYSNEMAN